MGALRTVLDVARHDLRRRASDPFGLLVWLAIPVVIGVLLYLVFGGSGDGGGGPRADLVIVDRDDSVGSRMLLGAFSQASGAAPIDATVVDDELRARKALDRGQHSALLVVPEGFEQTLLRETPSTLELVVNPSQRILPAMVEETLELLREAHFYAHRVLGGSIARIVDTGASPPSDAEVASISTEVNRAVNDLAGWLAPPRLDLELVVEEPAPETGGYADSLGFGGLALASLLAMTILFAAVGQSEDLWVERAQGTLARVLCTPLGGSAWLAGKVLAVAVLLGGMGGLGLGVACVGFGLVFDGALLAVAWLAVSGAALFAGLLLLQSLGRTQRAGNLLANGLSFPLLMLGGGFFPLEVMPDGLAAIGRWTPLGLAIERLKALLAGEPVGLALAVDVAGAFAVTALLTTLVGVRLRRFARA
ncbi:MAG: ABC transporter permease [Planctomycetota bacterium]